MACDPQKPLFVHEFSMLAAWPGACHASKKIAKFKANTLTKKNIQNRCTNKFWVAFSTSGAGASKEAPKSFPEPFPGGSRGPPGSSWQGQDGPKRRQEWPKSRQDRPKSSPGAPPERSWQPSGAQLPPKRSPDAMLASIFNPAGADFEGLGRFFCRQLLAPKRLANTGWSAV